MNSLVASFALTNQARTGSAIAATSGGSQSTTVNTPFGSVLEATVTAAGGVTVPNVAVTFTLPGGTGASGTFATGGLTRVEITNAAGIARSPAILANLKSGTFNATARVAGVAGTASYPLTNRAGDPATITPRVGAQTANVYAAFTTAVSVVVRDQYGNPVVGRTIGFVSPSSGASGTFAIDGVTTTGIGMGTNASGIATAPPFTANGIVGTYVVRAISLFPAPIETTFAMTNRTGSTSTVALLEGSPQSTVAGMPFAQALKVVVRAANGSPVENAQVTFTLPTGTLSATFAGATPASAVVFTQADGTATSPPMTAKTRSGTFTARAAVAGISGSLTMPLDVLPAAPATIQANGVGNQSAVVNAPFALAPSVRVLDAHGNRVPGVAVVFDVPPAPGPPAVSLVGRHSQ